MHDCDCTIVIAATEPAGTWLQLIAVAGAELRRAMSGAAEEMASAVAQWEVSAQRREQAASRRAVLGADAIMRAEAREANQTALHAVQVTGGLRCAALRCCTHPA